MQYNDTIGATFVLICCLIVLVLIRNNTMDLVDICMDRSSTLQQLCECLNVHNMRCNVNKLLNLQ